MLEFGPGICHIRDESGTYETNTGPDPLTRFECYNRQILMKPVLFRLAVVVVATLLCYLVCASLDVWSRFAEWSQGVAFLHLDELLLPLLTLAVGLLWISWQRAAAGDAGGAQSPDSKYVLEGIIEGTSDLIGAVDSRMRATAFNSALAEEVESIFGVKLALGMDMRLALSSFPDDQGNVLDRWKRVLRGERTTFVEQFGDRDRVRKYYEITNSPIRNELGKIMGAAYIMRDISERKKTEEALRRSERLAAVGTLAAGIAHEINNPLASILMAAENGLRSLQEPSQSGKALTVIMTEVQRCGRIVKNVLKFSRADVGERTIADVNTLVEHVTTLMKHHVESQNAQLKTALAEDLPVLRVNTTEIEQVLVNMITNALNAGARTIEVRTRVLDDHIELEIADDGRGMEETEKGQLFDAFYTTRSDEGGTGLGLSLSHGIVSEHGGRIDVESSPGKGSVMTVVLPVEG